MRASSVLVVLALSLSGAVSAAEPPAASPPVSRQSRSPREIARQSFAEGVSFAHAGRYEEARSAFLAAYAAQPHYAVLYNVAQAELQLGQREAARVYLRRYLLEGAGLISPERRRAVERELEALGDPPLARGAVASPSTTPPDQPTSEGIRTGAGARDTSRPQPGGDSMASRLALTAPMNDNHAVLGYVLTTAGFAVVGGAVGLFVWNHERHQRWRRENDVLMSLREEPDPALTADAAARLQERVERNNALLSAIQRFDAVPLVTGGLGLAAMGVGLSVLVGSGDGAGVRVTSEASGLAVRAHWVW